HIGPGAFSRLRSLDTATGAQQWEQAVTNDAFVLVTTRGGATVQGDHVLVGIYGALISGSLTVFGGSTFRLPLNAGGPPTHLSLFGLFDPVVPFGPNLAVENNFFTGSTNAPQDCAFGPPTLQVWEPGSFGAAWSAPGGGRPVVIDDQLLVASGST